MGNPNVFRHLFDMCDAIGKQPQLFLDNGHEHIYNFE
jgi:hypothetical protein